MLRIAVAIACLLFFAFPAIASCALATGPCSTDGYGNTYRTERNLGGGYTTYQNGRADSYHSQTLGGGWRERDTRGSVRGYHNTHPMGRHRQLR